MLRFPQQEESKCCDKKGCPPILDAGCNTRYCPKDFELDPLCNYPGITGIVDGEAPCILYHGQVDNECIGCKKDCRHPGYCPINLGRL